MAENETCFSGYKSISIEGVRALSEREITRADQRHLKRWDLDLLRFGEESGLLPPSSIDSE